MKQSNIHMIRARNYLLLPMLQAKRVISSTNEKVISWQIDRSLKKIITHSDDTKKVVAVVIILLIWNLFKK